MTERVNERLASLYSTVSEEIQSMTSEVREMNEAAQSVSSREVCQEVEDDKNNSAGSQPGANNIAAGGYNAIRNLTETLEDERRGLYIRAQQLDTREQELEIARARLQLR